MMSALGPLHTVLVGTANPRPPELAAGWLPLKPAAKHITKGSPALYGDFPHPGGWGRTRDGRSARVRMRYLVRSRAGGRGIPAVLPELPARSAGIAEAAVHARMYSPLGEEGHVRHTSRPRAFRTNIIIICQVPSLAEFRCA